MVWSSKHFFVAGRGQLINSVLMSIHLYWAQVFILPNLIERYRKDFTRPGYVSWDQICTPKKARGLGLKSLSK
ncbi:hypothetical protein RDABS01_009697 [Bienertia sinuspersici]